MFGETKILRKNPTQWPIIWTVDWIDLVKRDLFEDFAMEDSCLGNQVGRRAFRALLGTFCEFVSLILVPMLTGYRIWLL